MRYSGMAGPSPRGRGNPRDAAGATFRLRSIPAWAGKPEAIMWDPSTEGVHPRVGGETGYSTDWSTRYQGPSPRGRGNQRDRLADVVADGSIPAWAGKPASHPSPPASLEVHPRVGGETRSLSVGCACVKGPSPRGRGNPTSASVSEMASRSIPAWAGKPSLKSTTRYAKRVHPRVGGETAGRRIA